MKEDIIISYLEKEKKNSVKTVLFLKRKNLKSI